MKYEAVLIFFLFFLSNINCIAQETTINTDRPDQSDGVSVVPVGKFQIEEGITLAKETTLSDLALRYGITRSTEVRLIFEVGKELIKEGLKPVTLGMKQKIIEQYGIFPSITFVGYLSYDQLATKDFQDDEWSFQTKLAFENELSDRFSLGYNVGTANKFENLDLSLNLGCAATPKVTAFIEYFSTIDRINSEHNVDMGVLYLITPLFQADVALGHSIFANDDRFFTSFGLSYLFN